jgi:hypothetical protein
MQSERERSSLPHIPTKSRARSGAPKEIMYIQNITRADHPRRRLSLRFHDTPRPQPQPAQPLARKDLQRIVAEMLG